MAQDAGNKVTKVVEGVHHPNNRRKAKVNRELRQNKNRDVYEAL